VKLIIPALAGECVRASASSGYAIVVEDVPALDRSCPSWRSMNSRLRQRAAMGERSISH
jgi:hypothetical protein